MILKGCVAHVQSFNQSSVVGSETLLRIPGSNLLGEVLGFPVRVDLSDLPAAFWSTVDDDGRNIRVMLQDGPSLPVDVINIDKGPREGELFFKAPILAPETDSYFRVLTLPGAEAVVHTDPAGRNAVWSDFEAVFMFSSLENRTGSGLDASLVGSEAVVGEPGWLNLAGAGSANVRGVRKLTEWTMGASVIPRNTSANGAILSYGPWATGTANRASLALQNSSRYGIWNSTNRWLYAPAPDAQIGVRERLHHSQNGTSGRSIWRNGALGNSAASSAQRPGGSGDVLFIGAENLSYGERLYGSINYVYLREGVLSAAWIDAEYKSWEAGTLYEVIIPESF